MSQRTGTACRYVRKSIRECAQWWSGSRMHNSIHICMFSFITHSLYPISLPSTSNFQFCTACFVFFCFSFFSFFSCRPSSSDIIHSSFPPCKYTYYNSSSTTSIIYHDYYYSRKESRFVHNTISA
jgi:hypothetical protein